MKFDMKKPCPKCPFRTDVKPYISAARAREIATAITAQQQTFACHLTTDHDGEDGEYFPSADEQHCAGALILLERVNQPNQMMHIAERLRMYAASKLDMDAPVYATPAKFIAAHRR